MSTVLVIARAEMRRIFLSPLAWAVLAIVQGACFEDLRRECRRCATAEIESVIGRSGTVTLA